MSKKITKSDIVRRADKLARMAGLADVHSAELSPPSADLTAAELDALQSELQAIVPPSNRGAGDSILIAFSAKYLPALADALRAASDASHRTTLSALINILSLLPQPITNAYFRRFLRSPHCARARLPTLVASAFVAGIDIRAPSSPGEVCEFISHSLQWGDTSIGNDQLASIDAPVRRALAPKLAALESEDGFAQLPQLERAGIGRLAGILECIEHVPGYLASSYDYLQGRVTGQRECMVCMKHDRLLACSVCKTVKYCGERCQMKGWKEHQLRCYAPAFAYD
ncbi:hypothetical protein CERSUDRAFT_145772 [Gelatoporia subvermispora B]|uniref:MYND-type domain-containing protein n=1 Tax=Ceriporiopsis subvermispora (strain B) TaxID=914234 RepID=M2QFT0_CERS8|nr:hypothetical protein CERSUDRAFT_145772 [Gelatoporia subvermispora B]